MNVGAVLSVSSAWGGLTVMADFYGQVRVGGVNMGEDGDMLLFQWGTYSWGEERCFEVSVVRQLILPSLDDDDASLVPPRAQRLLERALT